MRYYFQLIIVGAAIIGTGVLIMERRDPHTMPSWRAAVLVGSLVGGCLLGLVGFIGVFYELLRR